MSTTPLSKKLLIKPGQRVLFLNAPAGYLDELGPLPDGTESSSVPGGDFELVHLFVKDVEELTRLAPVAIGAVKPDGILWISYPKRSSKVETDLTRDIGWDVVAQAGLRPVTQVSVNDVWSALRFRPVDQVGKKAG